MSGGDDDPKELPKQHSCITVVNITTSRVLNIELENTSQVRFCDIFLTAMERIPSLDNAQMELAVASPSCWTWSERGKVVLCPGPSCTTKMDALTVIQSHGTRFQLQIMESKSDVGCTACKSSYLILQKWRKQLSQDGLQLKGDIRTIYVQQSDGIWAQSVKIGMKNTVQDLLDHCKRSSRLPMRSDPYLVIRNHPYLIRTTKLGLLIHKYSVDMFEISTAPICFGTKRIREASSDSSSPASSQVVSAKEARGTNRASKTPNMILDLLGAYRAERPSSPD